MTSDSSLFSLLFAAARTAGAASAQTVVPTADDTVTLAAFEVSGTKLGRTAQETQISGAALNGSEYAPRAIVVLAVFFPLVGLRLIVLGVGSLAARLWHRAMHVA